MANPVYTTQLCGDWNKPLYGFLLNNQDSRESKRFFFRGSFKCLVLIAPWKTNTVAAVQFFACNFLVSMLVFQEVSLLLTSCQCFVCFSIWYDYSGFAFSNHLMRTFDIWFMQLFIWRVKLATLFHRKWTEHIIIHYTFQFQTFCQQLPDRIFQKRKGFW